MGIIKTTQYFIFEKNNPMPKAMYIHRYDPIGILVVHPAHIVYIDMEQKEVNNERDAKRMVICYSIDKVFYRVSTSNEDEEIYLGVPKGYTEEDMISILPPNKKYSFEKINNPL